MVAHASFAPVHIPNKRERVTLADLGWHGKEVGHMNPP